MQVANELIVSAVAPFGPCGPASAVDANSAEALRQRLKRSTVSLYDLPVAFWRQVLDKEMNFHLGFFPESGCSFEESMKIAVRHIAGKIPPTARGRVLDVGCGWGGPALELYRMWKSDILALTISTTQTAHVDSLSPLFNDHIKALTWDADTGAFGELGKFDLFWLCDSLDHIVNRRNLFSSLCDAAEENSYLAVATHCKSDDITQQLHSEFMGIQPIQTTRDIVETIECGGWRVLSIEDCTHMTAPVWDFWLENLKTVPGAEAERLSLSLTHTQSSYQNGLLKYVQIVAKLA